MQRALVGLVCLLAARGLASCSSDGRATNGSAAAAGAPAVGGASGIAGANSLPVGAGSGGVADIPSANGGQSGQGSESAGDSGSGTTGGASSSPPATIFTSPDMPHCVWHGEAQHQILGSLNGEAVNVHALAMASELIGARFRTFVFESNYVYPLVLTWSEQPREDQPIPISGGTLLMRGDQPFAGQSFCITSGEFGSRSVQTQLDPPGRELLFHITGARAGDCTGPEVPTELYGCILRDGSYFPDALGVDFPVDPSRPAIDSTKALQDLTDQERADLCDWTAFMMGGYGTTVDCRPIGGSTGQNYRDREQCLAALFAHLCPTVTVEDSVSCTVALAAKRGCVYEADACYRSAVICH